MKPIIICLEGLTICEVVLMATKAMTDKGKIEYISTDIYKSDEYIGNFNSKYHYLKFEMELSDENHQKVYSLIRR